jgi:hypothetical protein
MSIPAAISHINIAVQKRSRNYVDNVGPGSSGSHGGKAGVVPPPESLSAVLTKDHRNELSFAGGLNQLSFAGALNSKRLHGSARIDGDSPSAGVIAKQASVGLPPVQKDVDYVRFSFPKVAKGDAGSALDSLDANEDLMHDMLMKAQKEGEEIDKPLLTEQQMFNELLDKMSGSQMVARAIQDITNFGDNAPQN